ncbi:hypothetical protein BCR37DRAFT_314552 [Protomyces lactucae-debilis]|uniref:DUF221-domain-containing protein n=1 Tax=Protomyces lactucae-debilis TaxID=2754530 RepID=A0A1Y2FFX8_PROLT|nr:uncharacterized protein BCR37DRAFT_314552 [Protomyces lactucae-debilis]ORY82517.1 hypothetical protein BCR37DRAFT_314552 [Protomyces lactucae-debilis]
MVVSVEDDPRLRHLKSGPLLQTQVVIALAIGITTFLAFCILRQRWARLYQYRKYLDCPEPPPLRPGLFGWLVDLFQIDDRQILATAGLDAVVFLAFFKMAIKFLATSAFFGLTVVVPVRYKFDTDDAWGNLTSVSVTPLKHHEKPKTWLWSYVAFSYFFTLLVWYFLAQTTRKVSALRQEYLGDQTTVTDRTVRLSGVPTELRSEEKLERHIGSLGIGAVDKVVICRHWGELDRRMEERNHILHSIEECWAVYARHDSKRPKMRLGFFGLAGRSTDCIDYYTMKLRMIDDAITAMRREKDAFKPTAMAFVTFKRVSSAQLAAQAVLDPRPLSLVARLAPAPGDIIWSNVYRTRSGRIIRQWIVFLLVVITTVLWFIPVGAISVLLSPEGIAKISPALSKFLDDHEQLHALAVGFLPTLAYTIFFALVPWIFNWFSYVQGYLDVSEVELAEVSKNFMFIFFNYFFVILVASSGATLLALTELDTRKIPQLLARILTQRAQFYVDLIILQCGMFPFRLLEFGTVFLYPFYKAGCKTPRDYNALRKGPNFNFAFYLPQCLFVFCICIIYSILSPAILCFGLIFFVLGYFSYKYQLIYAMDHPQHSTGKVWHIIYNRVILGLVVFQFTMIGTLSTQKVPIPTAFITPLPFLTIYVAQKFWHQFSPLADYIALRAIERDRSDSTTSQTVDENREEDDEYGHPYLTCPLEVPWTAEEEEHSA